MGARTVREVPRRRPVRAVCGGRTDDRVSRLRRWRRMGRRGRRSDDRCPVRERKRHRVDRWLAPDNAGLRARDVYLRECASCHRDDLEGTPPSIALLVGIGKRKDADTVARVIHEGAGRMPGFPYLGPEAVDALVRYLVDGENAPAGPSGASPVDLPYRFTGYRKFLDPDGYPAVAPPWGTLNAID